MSRRYTPLSRELAAVICSIAACRLERVESDYWTVCRDIDLDDASPSAQLAFAAFAFVVDQMNLDDSDTWPLRDDRRGTDPSWASWVDAEAEALIRTGWVPS